jgi:hypothetical protein
MEEISLIQHLLPGASPTVVLLLWFLLKDKLKKKDPNEDWRPQEMCRAHEKQIALLEQEIEERNREMQEIKGAVDCVRDEMERGFSRIHERIDRLMERRDHDSR